MSHEAKLTTESPTMATATELPWSRRRQTTATELPWSRRRQTTAQRHASSLLDEEIHKEEDTKASWYLLFMVAAVVIGGFLFGYNLSNINIPEVVIHGDNNPQVPKSKLPASIPMSNTVWGLAVSMLPLGGLIGSLSGGKLAEILGRKWLLAIADVSFVIAGVIMGVAMNVAMFMIGRIFVGISCGMSAAVVPGYLSEISPDAIRGKLGSSFQLSICLGTLVATAISIPLNNAPGWRWLVGLTSVPAALQLGLLFFMVESPKWLTMKGRVIEANVCLETLRGQRKKGAAIIGKDAEMAGKQAPYADTMVAQKKQASGDEKPPVLTTEEDLFSKIPLEEPEMSPQEMASAKTTALEKPGDSSVSQAMTLKEFFGIPSLIRALGVGIIIHLAQQLSGVNAIFYYSTKTFEEAYKDNSKYITLAIGIVNMISVIISAFTIDRLGRKMLLIIGQFITGLSLVALTLGFRFHIYPLLIVFVLIYIFAYSASAGAVTWVMTGELFPTRAFSIAASIAVAVNWLSNFVVGMTYPLLNTALGSYSFLPFVGCLILFIILTFIYVPETKGKSIEEITLEFQRVTKTAPR